jgi:nicotinamide phosphoribosyltransferase
MNLDLISLADGYKLSHRQQYPSGTQYVYSNWTAWATRVPNQNEVVFFDLQYVLQRYFMEFADQTFFKVRKADVLKKYQRNLDRYLGPNNIGVKHIADLHDLGYIPLEFRALPEGALVPLRVPMFTVENTHPDFFWVTNYFETLLSNVIWKGCTSATTASCQKVT